MHEDKFFHYHSCNENTFRDKVIGSILFAGRNWLKFWKLNLHSEWYFFHRAKNANFALYLEFGHGDGDDGLLFHVSIPYLFSIYVGIDQLFGKLFRGDMDSRQTGFSFHHGTLWLYPFSKTMSWSSRDRWWQQSHAFNIVEYICGRNKYSEIEESGWQDIKIGMPEKAYSGRLRFFTSVWKNRFSTRKIRRAEIEMEEGIPFPGKGENSWDCGEDATFGLTCPANDEVEAICAMIEHVLTSRRKYGSRHSVSNYVPVQIHRRSEPNKNASEDCKSTEACEGT